MKSHSMSDEDWSKKLTPEQYKIMRQKGTEAPFSGEYVDHHEHGMYTCAACGSQLFASDTKFDSKTGWPSFYDALPGAVEFHEDTSGGATRTEITCAKCGGHLGHIFEGEGYNNPTDKRFCINSACLNFMPKDQK